VTSQVAGAPAWHALTAHDALAELASDAARGLTPGEARARLREFGANQLEALGRTPWYGVFFRQFTSALIVILLVAAAVSFLIGEVTDAATILAIVVLNGGLGLWMNLITDGVTAVALGAEPAERGVLERPPASPAAPILDRTGALLIAAVGGYIGLATLALYYYGRSGSAEEAAAAQTLAFTGIVLLEKVNVFNFRSLRAPLAVVGYLSNPWILAAWASMLALQAAAVYVPFMQDALHTAPLGWEEWAAIAIAALPLFAIVEAVKWTRWRRAGTKAASGP
jgi:magnesium-transporting ATPase (P-type)